MDIKLICVGKLKESYWREACEEYAKRLSAYCKFSIVEIAESRLDKEPSAAQIADCIDKEGKAILAKLPSSSAMIIAMCVEGSITSSEQLAASIAKGALEGKSTVCVIIGGSYGLSDEVKRRADMRISIGRMTFPHQLCRVMLCEQLYRACSINSNGKYHK